MRWCFIFPENLSDHQLQWGYINLQLLRPDPILPDTCTHKNCKTVKKSLLFFFSCQMTSKVLILQVFPYALLPTENTQYIFQLQWWLTVLYHFATRSDTTCKRRTTGERNRRDSGSILYRQYLIATMNNSCCKVRATSVTELLA